MRASDDNDDWLARRTDRRICDSPLLCSLFPNFSVWEINYI